MTIFSVQSTRPNEQSDDRTLQFEIGTCLTEPSSDSCWVSCLALAAHIKCYEPNPAVWNVGRTDREYLNLLLVCVSREKLKEHATDFNQLREEAVQRNVLIPGEEDMRTCSTNQAVQNARIRILKNAVEGIERWGRGLLEGYRQIIFDRYILVPMERLSLTKEIMEVHPRTFDRLLAFFRLVGVHLLGNTDSPAASKFLRRSRDKWLSLLKEFGRNGKDTPAKNVVAEMHILSLLRAAFELVGGSVDVKQHEFSWERTAAENILDLGNILGIRVKTPKSFSTFDAERISDTLLHFDGVCIIKDALGGEDLMTKERILRFLPIGVSEPSLPDVVVDNISLATIRTFQMERSQTYRDVPWLQQSTDNSMCLFICFCGNLPEVPQIFLHWITSKDGDLYRRHMIERIFGDSDKEQITLRIATIVTLEKLLPARLDEVSQPLNGWFLSDFINKTTASRRATWIHMGQSANRAIKCHSTISKILHRATSHEYLHPFDGLSDIFWRYVVNNGWTSSQAFAQTSRAFKKLLEICSAGGLDSAFNGSDGIGGNDFDSTIAQMGSLGISFKNDGEIGLKQSHVRDRLPVLCGKDPDDTSNDGRHKTVWGGGICPACAEGQENSGCYGSNVLSKERYL